MSLRAQERELVSMTLRTLVDVRFHNCAVNVSKDFLYTQVNKMLSMYDKTNGLNPTPVVWWWRQMMRRLCCAQKYFVSMHMYLSTSHPQINQKKWQVASRGHDVNLNLSFQSFLFLMKSVFLIGKSMVMSVLNKGIPALSIELFSPNHTWVQCLLYSSATWNRLWWLETLVYFNSSTVE